MRTANFNMSKLFVISSIIAGCFIITGCKKENKIYPVPAIQFITKQGYVFNDTTLLLNNTIKIGIIAETNSDEELTQFNTTIDKDSIITSIDTGIYANKFEYEKKIIKGIAENEIWSFYIRDRDGRKSNVISITFKLDFASIFSDIKYIPSIIFGAQNNASTGSFYSLSTEQIYTQSEAYNNQSLINLLYFYDLIETDENTISSPGANIDDSVFPGSTGLSNWTEINTTRFVYQDNISPEEFDICNNDSLILSNTFEFASGKRKAKNLAQGYIYSFVTEDEKKGLFKVIDVQNEETGTIEISIKMQD